MVDEQLIARGIADPSTLAAMGKVERERFVPPDLRHRAYDDGALAIGGGQTISQPYIVARMTELLGLAAWSAVHPARSPAALDVGTGSGYQAAVLAELGARVTSIERDAGLAAAARDRLSDLAERIVIVVGDGSEGWPEGAPYDAIVVGAAAPEVPEPLVEQLADGARLVIPIGRRDAQRIVLVRRDGARTLRTEHDPCVFVPLVGHHGFAA
jgi:protein-L-isoaspartate(D-aspartate) O-methyltransferase